MNPLPSDPDGATDDAADGGRGSRRGLRGGLSRGVRCIAAASVVAAAVLVVTPRLGSSVHQVGPGQVAIGLQPALRGSTTLAVPPIGLASAPTHEGPAQLRLELRSLDVARLLDDGGRIDTAQLQSSIVADLRRAVVPVVARYLVVGVIVGAIAAGLLPRRSWRTVVGGAIEGLVVSGLVVVSVVPGFDVARFENLTFEGPVTTGGRVVAALSSTDGPVGRRADALAQKLAGLYSASATADLAADDEVVLLHISDLHLNPVGAQLARRLATAFGVDAVVDTGDTTSFGTQFEGAFAEALAGFPVPYLFVGGNHDSIANRQAIAAAPGVTAIDRRVYVVGSGDQAVRIVGFDDPIVTTTEQIPRADRERRELAATPELRSLIAAERPDVLAIHNPVILQRVVGSVPLAIGGHQHLTRFGARRGTLVSLVGSTGATGLGSLLVDAELPSSASLLRFRSGRLVAVDSLEVIGTSGDMVITRHTITDADRSADTADFIGRDADEGTLPADDGDGGSEPPTTTEVPTTTEPTTSEPTTTEPPSTIGGR